MGMRFDELLKEIERLPYTQFRQTVEHYSNAHSLDFQKEWNRTVYQNFEQRLEALQINTACPHCGSVAVQRYGERNGIQRFRCVDCHKTFTRFTGTILEKSRWHWDVWVKVLEMTLNDYSLETMKRVLETDLDCKGINIKTLHAWRLKLVHATARMPQPILHGVVQIDETHLRESQKAARGELVSYIKGEERKPRRGRQPSKYGVMGPEFSTIITAIDSAGYCVCYVVSLGKAATDHLIDLFEAHLDCPAFLCSDGNSIYSHFCDTYDIPHYCRPSNYTTVTEKAGYISMPDSEEQRVRNRMVLERLYREGNIDRIHHRQDLVYAEFEKIKRTYGLSLARVNELHKDIKLLLEKHMTNVSTKYLSYYIGFFSYRRNWRVAHGHYPSANRDAEEIFIDLLRQKVNYTIPQQRATELNLPKPSGRYVQILKERTETARQITKNKYFKFDEEDNVTGFNVRQILLDAPESKLRAIGKEHKIKGYTKMGNWVLASSIAKLPNIDEIIIQLITADRHYEIADEDIKYLQSLRFRRSED